MHSTPSKSLNLLKKALPVACLAVLMAPSLDARASTSPFGPAENMTWECRFLGLPIGKAVLMVGGSTTVEGKNVWPVIGMAKTDPLFAFFPLKDKYVSWWNPAEHVNLGSELIAEEKGARRRERVRFDRQANRALSRNEKEGQQVEEQEHEVPEGAVDMLSALLRVREAKLAVGDHLEVPIFTGHRNFTLKADVARRDKVEVAAGSFETVLLNVQVELTGNLATKRDLRIWVTDDERHVPVKMDADFVVGSLVADLTHYERGTSR